MRAQGAFGPLDTDAQCVRLSQQVVQSFLPFKLCFLFSNQCSKLLLLCFSLLCNWLQKISWANSLKYLENILITTFNFEDSRFDFWHKEVIFIWIWKGKRISPRRQHSLARHKQIINFMILNWTFTFIFSFSTSLAKASTMSINPPTIFWNSPISKEQNNQYE